MLQGELKAVEEALGRHDEDLARLQSKLQEAKAKQKALLIRLNAAQKRVQVRRTLADGRVDDAAGALSRPSISKIDELEGRAEVYDMGQDQDPGAGVRQP